MQALNKFISHQYMEALCYMLSGFFISQHTEIYSCIYTKCPLQLGDEVHQPLI